MIVEKYAFGIIHCTGVDAEKFLQGQLSADMTALSDTQGALSCYLNLKGRVIALLSVIKRPDGYWLVLPSDLLPSFMQKLKKFIVFSKATLTDVSLAYHVEGNVETPNTLPPYHVSVEGDTVVFCLSPTAGLSLRITPSLQIDTPLSHDFMKAMFHALIPWISLEQSEKFLPHYIHLVTLGTIAFDKGCFVGQEVVARMHYRGHLNKTLRFMEMPSSETMAIEGEMVNRLDSGENSFVLVSLVGTNP